MKLRELFLFFLASPVLMAGLYLTGCKDVNTEEPPSPPTENPSFLITGAGTPLAGGVTVSAIIGAAGGSLVSEDGLLRVEVPAGAVGGDTAFAITPVENPAGNGVVTYDLEPEGVTFADKVKVTFAAPDAGITRTGIEGLGIAYRKTGGTWEWISAVRDGTNKTLSVEVDHFCQLSELEGIQLSPLSSRVKTGKTQGFQVMSTLSPESEDWEDSLASLTPVYEPYPVESGANQLGNWAVEGLAGGNSTYGTIAGNDTAATYTAPGSKPSQETVYISVRTAPIICSDPTEFYLHASVKIYDYSTYAGTFEVVADTGGVGETWLAEGEATLTPTGDNEYSVTGTITPTSVPGPATVDYTQSFSYPSAYLPVDESHPTMYWVIPMMSWTGYVGSTSYPGYLLLNWASGLFGPAEIDASVYPDHLKGSYTFVPYAHPSATVSWDFVRQD